MVVDRVHKQKIGKPNHVSFKRIMKMSYHNHGYLDKHTLEHCDLIKWYIKGNYKTVSTDKLARPTSDEEKGDAFPNPKVCLMIFSRMVAYESRC